MLGTPELYCRIPKGLLCPFPWSHLLVVASSHFHLTGDPDCCTSGPTLNDLPWWGLVSGSLGRCLEGSWEGCRLRKLLGAARAWPCSCSSGRLPALVPLTTAPFSLPLAGGARCYRGGKLSLGAGRAPRRARGSCWSGAQSPRGEVKDGRQQLPDPRKPRLQLPRGPPPRLPRDAAAAGGTRISWLRTDCSVLGCSGVFQTYLRCVSALGIPGQTLTSEAASTGPSSRRDLGNQVRFCQGESWGSGGSREPGHLEGPRLWMLRLELMTAPPARPAAPALFIFSS